MPLGDHAAHWSSYIGEVIRGVPLYYPSWLKVLKERKAALITDIGTQFDLRPHMESPDWTEINAGIQQHLQKAYNTNKVAFKAHHWVIDRDLLCGEDQADTRKEEAVATAPTLMMRFNPWLEGVSSEGTFSVLVGYCQHGPQPAQVRPRLKARSTAYTKSGEFGAGTTRRVPDDQRTKDEDAMAIMSADVARSHGNDGGGEDHPPPHHVPSGCMGCFANRGKGKRKPNLGGKAAGRLNTPDKTRNLSLKEITDKKGPVPIRFELRDKQTVMPLGDHAAHWSSYIGEVIRGVPLYYPSWLKVPKERKAALITDIGTQFDLRPHMESPDWTEINAGIQQHLQKAYNTNKAAFKAQHWVIDPTTGTYNVEKIRRARPEDITAEEWDKDPGRLLAFEMRWQSSGTQEYPSLIDTFFVAHTVNGEFLQDEDRRIYEEMRRLEATGTYSDDEINRLARRDKQRGHIPGVGRFESGGASGSGGCRDDEESADDQEDEDEDGDGDNSGVVKNMKKPGQAPRGVPVGPKVGFKPVKQVFRQVSKKNNVNTSGNKKKDADAEPTIEVSNSNSFDVLNSVEIDVYLGTNSGTSNLASKKANFGGSSSLNVEASSTNTTPIVDKINKYEKLVIDGKVSLVDDEGKSLKNVAYSDNHDSEDEVESVDNNMAHFMALEMVGFGNNSLLEQLRDTYENVDYDYDPYDDDGYEGQKIPDNIQSICDNLDITVRDGTLKVEHMIGQEATEEIASTGAETNSGDYTPYENHEYQQYQGLQPELSQDDRSLIGKVAADHSHKWIFKEPSDQEINFLSTWNNSADSHPRTWEAQFQAGIKTIALVAVREGVIQLGSIHKVIEDLSYVVMLRKKLSYIESIPGVLLPHPSASLYPFKPEGYNTPEAWPSFHGGVNDLAATPYNQPLNVTPSMSSLEALLSKLPSVVPVCSSPMAAPPFCEAAQPHFVTVSPEKEVAEDEEIKDVGESSSSMSSYGHHHQHFAHHEMNVSSCMANNRY
ncbi:F-box domain containing protein [Tanacetum coccineum]|uniref:F-box domain containing protein n=1 Tax=Tanacetum coccineum TaxID=301880 RepID=A0ABQ5D0L4_9ASTR